MANDASKVSTGKPKIGGAIYRAPVGTTLPTDAVSTLNAAFNCLGYCSDDGLTNDNSMEMEEIKAWGGDTVLYSQTSKDDEFGFTLIEIMNEYVLKAVYGDDNVTVNSEAGTITIRANSSEQEDAAYVIDMILKGGALKRIVIPAGKVTEVGTITYKDDEAIGYETTLGCTPDASGNTHYEYIKLAS